MIKVSPYINFQGRAREAFEFYHAALGGELTLLAGDGQNPPKLAGSNDPIMHGALVGEGFLILGSDGHPDYPPTHGYNMAITITGNDRDQLSTVFDILSAGGNVKQSLKTESWGDTFGYFEDAFGINWMVNITTD